MQETQVKETTESRSMEASVNQVAPKSRFDEAEYQRWAEKLRIAASPKNK